MDSVTETTIYIILDVILAFTVIIGNLLVCCVILYSRALRRKVIYYYIFLICEQKMRLYFSINNRLLKGD